MSSVTEIAPLSASPDLAELTAAVRLLIENSRAREPSAFGSPDQKFLTLGVAMGAGLLEYTGAGGVGVPPGIGGGGGGGDGDPPIDLSPPIPITGLTVTAGLTNFIIEFDAPTYSNGGGNAYTEVYAANYSGTGPLPLFADAVPAGTIAGRGSVGLFGAQTGQTTHFWGGAVTRGGVRQVDVSGPTGGTHGVAATTGQDVSHLLGVLAGQITSSELSASLSEPIERLADSLNLVVSDWWAPGANATTYGWTYNSTTAGENTFVFSPDPNNRTSVLWRCTSVDGNTGPQEPDGGWNAPLTVDRTKPYRFAVPVRRSAGTSGAVFWGCTGACDLNTATANANPYFSTLALSALVPNRWYWMVGYVFPAGSTGRSHAGAGIYDPTIGANVATGSQNFCWHASNAAGHRAYLYYADEVGAIADFGRPMVHLLDGNEPALESILAGAAGVYSAASALIEQESIVRALEDGKFSAQVYTKIDLAGHVSGYGLSSTNANGAPTSAFGVRTDQFWVAPPSVAQATPPTVNLYDGFVWLDTSGAPAVTRYWNALLAAWVTTAPSLPFVIQTTPTTINGVPVQPGMYVKDAFIMNGTITNAKIANLAVDDAKIANLSAAKLTAGAIDVGEYIESSGFVSGSAGWRIRGDGVAEFSGVIVRGTVYATAGAIGGALIDASGIESDNYAANTTGWRLDNDDGILAFQGQIGGFTIVGKRLTLGTATLAGTGDGIAMGTDTDTKHKLFVGDDDSALYWNGDELVIRGTPKVEKGAPRGFNPIVSGFQLATGVPSKARITINTNGTYSVRSDADAPVVQGNWYLPTTTGIGSGYVLVAQAYGSPLSIGTTNTELPLTSARDFEIEQPVISPEGSKETLMTFIVKKTSDGSVLVIGNGSMDATYAA